MCSFLRQFFCFGLVFCSFLPIQIVRSAWLVPLFERQKVTVADQDDFDSLNHYDIAQKVNLHTRVGEIGLQHELHPFYSLKQVQEKQKNYIFLLKNCEIKNEIEQLLTSVDGDLYRDLLPFWDPKNRLHHVCERYFFTSNKLKKYNKNSGVLSVKWTLDMCFAVKSLANFFVMWNVIPRLMKDLADKNEVKFLDLFNALSGTLKDQHNWKNPKGFKENMSFIDVAIDHVPYWSSATLRARYEMLRHLKLPKISWSDSKNIEIVNKGVSSSGWLAQSKALIEKALAMTGASLPTIYYDWNLVKTVRNSWYVLQQSYKSMDALRARQLHIQKALQKIMRIFDIFNAHKELSPVCDVISNMNVQHKKDLLEIMNAFSASTFSGTHKWLYSRGEVLKLQRMLQEKKDCFIPLLEFVATVDARVGITNLLIDSQDTDHQWTMVNFVDTSAVKMNYKDLWLPLHATDKPIVNDVMLGCNGRANKSIIAGANGGGKTSYLKSIGIAALLAQSWGVVPAAYAEQSWFSSVRTCLNPAEDLAKGLSKFMVQKQRMDNYILPHVSQAVEKNEQILLLIDEPYSGTVEVEKNMRTNKFCNAVKDYDNCLMTLVTHLEEPTELADKYKGSFINQYVRIDWDNDHPMRTFKICDGKDKWWFDDHEKRALFIDQSY